MSKNFMITNLKGNGKGVWAATIIGLVLLASALAAYNMDSLYLGGRGGDNLIIASSGTFTAGQENSFFIGFHDSSGAPITEDMQVYLKTGDVERLLFSGKTDSQGLCRVSFTAPENIGTATLVARSGQKTVEQAVRIAASSSARPDTDIKFVITTDKPVYQPGQVVHIRSLAINQPGGAYQGPVILEILTPEGDKITRQEMDTNEYGVAFYDLHLGNSLPLGQYTIRFSIGSEIWEKKVVVDRYVLPRFDMRLEGLRTWYSSDQEIIIGLNVEYFFGKPVDGELKVKTDIYATTGYYDYWNDDLWIGEGWGEAMPGSPEDERMAFEPQPAMDIASAPPSYYSTSTWTTINYQTLYIVDGYVEITIPALETVMDEYSYGYWGTHALRMNMTVTDTAYHVESKQYASVVSTTPIIVSVLGDTSVPGAPSVYNILAQRPDGQPIPGAMVDLGGGVASTTTDRWGLATIEYEYEGQNSLLLRVESGDDDASVSLPVAAWLNEIKIVANRPFYEMGDNARFTIYDTYGWGRVYWEARGARGTIAVGSISIEDGMGTLDLTITPEMSPYIDMWVYRTGYDMAGDSLLVTVKPTGGLKVDITTPQSMYRPGERVDMTFSVTNMQGHMPGVIGLSIIDRAVLELGDRYLGLEGIFFEDAYDGGDYRIMFSSYVGDPDYAYLPPVGQGSEYRDSSAIMSVGLSQTINNDVAAAENLKAGAVQTFWIIVGAAALAGLLIYISIHGKNVGRGKMLGAFFLLAIFASAAILGSFVMVQNASMEDTYTDRMAGDEAASPTPALDGAGGAVPPGEERIWDDSAAAPVFFWETGAMMPTNGTQYSQVRTRTFFPETWFWQPMLILDNWGEANISLTAPDSITSWEIQAVASTTDGKVGLGNHNITVFQEFFIEPDLPYSLLRNDTVTMPVTIYNYGDNRSVTVSIENGPWFETLSPTTIHTNVLSDTVTAVNFTIKATEVGKHRLNVTASAGMVGDAITKEVRVRSDGLMNMTVENGVLVNTTSFSKTFQPDPARIAGSEELYVKLQAGITAITVDGADQFIQHVYGCGEQSLSTLSIDILAFNHIRDSTLSSSRLSEFESIVKKGIQHQLQYVEKASNNQGRGIVWFPGDQDVHPWLTAWGLITFQDALEAGFYVDPAVISDMQTWLISQQRTDGSWAFPNWGLYETANQALLEKEAGATAYIVRALLHAGMGPGDAPITAAMSYLASKAGSYTDDPYTVAIMLLSLEMGQGSPSARANLLNSLIGHAIWDGDGVRWEGETSLTSYDRYWGPANAHTIETTAYAVLALQERGGHSAYITGGIRYMLDSRLGMGGFYSTQDTVVAFHAISKAGNVEMETVTVNVLANGAMVSTRSFDNDTLDLTHYVDIPVSLPVEITIETTGIGQVIYQIIYAEYLPWTPPTYAGLELELVFSDTTISVGETIEVSATLFYNGTHDLIQMVLVRLVAPTGFSFLNNDFDILQQKGMISYYDGWGSDRNLYIQPVRKGETITFTYHLSNRVPVQTIAEGSFAFDMYNPALSAQVMPQAITAS